MGGPGGSQWGGDTRGDAGGSQVSPGGSRGSAPSVAAVRDRRRQGAPPPPQRFRGRAPGGGGAAAPGGGASPRPRPAPRAAVASPGPAPRAPPAAGLVSGQAWSGHAPGPTLSATRTCTAPPARSTRAAQRSSALCRLPSVSPLSPSLGVPCPPASAAAAPRNTRARDAPGSRPHLRDSEGLGTDPPRPPRGPMVGDTPGGATPHSRHSPRSGPAGGSHGLSQLGIAGVIHGHRGAGTETGGQRASLGGGHGEGTETPWRGRIGVLRETRDPPVGTRWGQDHLEGEEGVLGVLNWSPGLIQGLHPGEGSLFHQGVPERLIRLGGLFPGGAPELSQRLEGVWGGRAHL